MILLIIHTPIQSIAPSDTPQNVTTVALGPTSIRVTFYPPPEIDQNGVL